METKKLTDEQIEKIVNWWAEKVRAPKFNGLTEQERKDPRNDAYQLSEMMASALVKPISGSQLNEFKKVLAEKIRDLDWYDINLAVDYDPTRILADAAEQAGIPKTNFPWKTTMFFDMNGKIKTRSGYGAEIVEL